jgi:hypothetical protein
VVLNGLTGHSPSLRARDAVVPRGRLWLCQLSGL